MQVLWNLQNSMQSNGMTVVESSYIYFLAMTLFKTMNIELVIVLQFVSKIVYPRRQHIDAEGPPQIAVEFLHNCGFKNVDDQNNALIW